MEEYLKGLIERMLDKSDSNMVPFQSSRTISWKACREAEEIDKLEFIPQLISFIDAENDREKRDRAYFVLAHVAKNTKNDNATKFLINRINQEQDKSVISSLLDRIQYLRKPADTDLSPIFNAIKSKIWQIRSSAIQALKCSDNNLAENTLIGIITNSKDEYDLIYSNVSLSDVGTRNAIAPLLNLLEHKNRDVSGTALKAILELSNKSDLNVFIEQLEKGKNKFTALLGVIKYGDHSVVPHVVKRVRQLVSKKRAIQIVADKGKTEVIFALDFLLNYTKESTEPKKMLELLSTKKYENLWDNEKKWINENKNKF